MFNKKKQYFSKKKMLGVILTDGPQHMDKNLN